MVAINSALAVDITGQVCADSIGRSIYSGFGGQSISSAGSRSKGGKPVIALPSTAKDGTISRIVDSLTEGSGVVTTRADVHYVVTEHGVASLFGKCLRDRAQELIAIAHPTSGTSCAPRHGGATCCEELIHYGRGGGLMKPDQFGVNEDTRPDEAVKLAMERERKAREFYLRCAGVVHDPGVKKMFEFLAKERAATSTSREGVRPFHRAGGVRCPAR